MNRVCSILAVLGLAVGTPTMTTSAQTITDIVAASGGEGEFDSNPYDFDMLLNAVLAAGLADELAELDNLTVFAPNDKAFIRLARDLGYDGSDEAEALDAILGALTAISGEDPPLTILTTVLTYHVAPQELDLFDVIIFSIFGEPIPTLAGPTIQPFFFKLIDNEPGLRNPRLTYPFNIEADNGIIHTINRVLIPIDLDEI